MRLWPHFLATLYCVSLLILGSVFSVYNSANKPTTYRSFSCFTSGSCSLAKYTKLCTVWQLNIRNMLWTFGGFPPVPLARGSAPGPRSGTFVPQTLSAYLPPNLTPLLLVSDAGDCYNQVMTLRAACQSRNHAGSSSSWAMSSHTTANLRLGHHSCELPDLLRRPVAVHQLPFTCR